MVNKKSKVKIQKPKVKSFPFAKASEGQAKFKNYET